MRHLNDDRTDNRPVNLALGTNVDNMRDAREAGAFTGDHARGVLNVNAKLDDASVVAMRAARAAGDSLASLSMGFGVSQSTVSSVVRRQTWVHVA